MYYQVWCSGIHIRTTVNSTCHMHCVGAHYLHTLHHHICYYCKVIPRPRQESLWLRTVQWEYFVWGANFKIKICRSRQSILSSFDHPYPYAYQFPVPVPPTIPRLTVPSNDDDDQSTRFDICKFFHWATSSGSGKVGSPCFAERTAFLPTPVLPYTPCCLRLALILAAICREYYHKTLYIERS